MRSRIVCVVCCGLRDGLWAIETRSLAGCLFGVWWPKHTPSCMMLLMGYYSTPPSCCAFCVCLCVYGGRWPGALRHTYTKWLLSISMLPYAFGIMHLLYHMYALQNASKLHTVVRMWIIVDWYESIYVHLSRYMAPILEIAMWRMEVLININD